MKIIKVFEVTSLFIGLGAVITLVFFLITNGDVTLRLYEPIWWIRFPEIVFGLFTSVFLIGMIWDKMLPLE